MYFLNHVAVCVCSQTLFMEIFFADCPLLARFVYDCVAGPGHYMFIMICMHVQYTWSISINKSYHGFFDNKRYNYMHHISPFPRGCGLYEIMHQVCILMLLFDPPLDYGSGSGLQFLLWIVPLPNPRMVLDYQEDSTRSHYPIIIILSI